MLLAASSNEDGRAFAREQPSRSAAHAAIATSDQRDLVLQPAHIGLPTVPPRYDRPGTRIGAIVGRDDNWSP